ncbi:MAG TPA: sigma 54-interacting transcriptional regulator [Polyangiaceae bacterium]
MSLRDTTEPVSIEVPAAPSTSKLRLEVVHSPDDGSIGATIALEPERTVLVGRDVTDGFRVRDRKVSRLHLRLVWDRVQGGFRYGDAGSANGTVVNGMTRESGLLLPNDVIRIGETLLVCVGRDHGAELLGRARAVARSALPVLVRGPTGSGKELLARAIHDASRRKGSFVALNCAALPPDLAGSELFGHVRGAFSGAGESRQGLFKTADHGTLLLDEIGDLNIELQGQLLRVLQDRRVRPLGSDRELQVDVRIIAATHIDLDEARKRGNFREDLLHRLAQIVLEVPPLRLRRSEIVRLVREFAPGVAITPSALEALLIADWPGNVRELRAVIESSVAELRDDTPLGLEELAARLPDAVQVVRARGPGATAAPAPPGTAAARRERLCELLRRHDGSITKVAQELGKPRAQVYRWIRSLGISRERFE